VAEAREESARLKWVNVTMPRMVKDAIEDIKNRILERDGQFVCVTCKQTKSKDYKVKHHSQCKECKRAQSKKYRPEPKEYIKVCSMCGIEKPLSLFRKSAFNSGNRYYKCLKCAKIDMRKVVRDRIVAENKSKLDSEIKTGFIVCAQCGNRHKVSDMIKSKGRIIRQCKPCSRLASLKWKQRQCATKEGREEFNRCIRERLHSNKPKMIVVALLRRRRKQIYNVVKRQSIADQIDKCNGRTREEAVLSWLGCSKEEFVIHIQNQFTKGMSWSNYGEWHIDHILALAWFDGNNEEHMKQAWHYTNMRPLWAMDNFCRPRKQCKVIHQPELILEQHNG
jgi:hypothetical protein